METYPDALCESHVLFSSMDAAALRAHSRADFRASLLVDRNGIVRWASENCDIVFGAPSHDLVGTVALGHVHPDDLSVVADVFAYESRVDTSYRRAISTRSTRLVRLLGTGGGERLVDAHLTNFFDDPAIGMLLIDLTVPTSMHAIDEAISLAHAGAPLSSVLDRVLRRLSQGIDGQVAAQIVAADGTTLTESSNAPSDDVASGGFAVTWTVPIGPVDSEPFATLHVWSSQDPVHPIDIDVAARVADHAAFVIAHQRTIDELARQALVDPLTGLGNRRSLDEAMDRRVEDDSVLLLFVDLDRFKAINDEHGHAVGDAVLSTVANRLHEAVRSDDLVVRVGGDEFVVLVGRTPPPIDVLVERLTLAVSAPIFYDDLVLSVSCSIGAASGPPNAALLSLADREMFVGKRRTWSALI